MSDDNFLKQRMVIVDFSHDSYLGGYDIGAVMLNARATKPYTKQYCSVPKDCDISIGDRGSFNQTQCGNNEKLVWKPMPKDEYTSEIYTIVCVFDIFKDGTIEIYGKDIGKKRILLRGLPHNTQVGHKLLLRSLKQALDKYEFVHNITMAKLVHDIDCGKYV